MYMQGHTISSYTGCIDCCISYSTGAGPGMVGGGGACSCMLLVQPTLTYTNAGHDLCT